MVTVLVVLVVVVALLGGAVVVGMKAARRSNSESDTKTDVLADRRATASLSDELFARSLRVDAVLEQARQARALMQLSGSYLLAELEGLRIQLEAACEVQRSKVVAVGPLTGESRQYAISLVDPGIAALEASALELLELAREAAAVAEVDAVPDDAEAVQRRARALHSALGELEAVDDAQRQIEAMLEGSPPPLRRLEPPQQS